MDGLILLDKPGGISSAKALYRVRKATGQRKSGHAGTLDPMATGVLILCLGRATKLVESLMGLPKVYRAVARLDVTSESFDADRPMTPVAVERPPTEAELSAALARFEGTHEQMPPAVSALKLGGRRAYRMKADEAVAQLKPRTSVIYWAVLHRYACPEVEFSLACGRGTYVRAIARDIGVALGTGGCLTALRRTAVGPFDVQAAHTLEAIDAARDHPPIIPLADATLLAASIRPPARPSS